MHVKKIIYALIALFTTLYQYQANAQNLLSYEEKMKEWNEAKFGMFIHWGLYAIPAKGEWYMRNSKVSVADYAKLASQFNPTQFNADEWVSIAKAAGMKYMVLTSKHHDGFAMFNTKATNYNIVTATPFKRDVLKELSIACAKQGMKLGIYYSTIADWHHAGGQAGCPHWDSAQNGDLDQYMATIAVPQVKELVTNYGTIYEFWFDNDGSKGITPQRAQPIFDLLKQYQPNIVRDPRLVSGDFETAEQHIPPIRPKGYWEACITTTGGWGYSDRPAKSLKQLLLNIIDIANKGGNILLNVGPDAKGLIPADNVVRLQQIGRWINTNKAAIYGTTASPFDCISWGKCTQKGNTLYFHIIDWPKDGKLHLPFNNPIAKAQFLANPSIKVSTKLVNEKQVAVLPTQPLDSIATVLAITITGEVKHQYSLALGKPVEASSKSERKPEYAVDTFAGTRWQSYDSTGWFQVDLKTPTKVSMLRVGYSYDAIKAFDLQYKDGDTWKTIFSDTNMPRDEYLKIFTPITAQYFRLNISKSTGKMNLNSFELFPSEE